MAICNLNSIYTQYRNKSLFVIVALYTISKEETRFMLEINHTVKSNPQTQTVLNELMDLCDAG